MMLRFDFGATLAFAGAVHVGVGALWVSLPSPAIPDPAVSLRLAAPEPEREPEPEPEDEPEPKPESPPPPKRKRERLTQRPAEPESVPQLVEPQTEPEPEPDPEPELEPEPDPEPPEPAVERPVAKADMRGYGRGIKASVIRHKRYPVAARRLGLQGKVKLKVAVDRSGQLVGRPEIHKSSGHEVLDNEAVRMVEAAAPFPAVPEGYSKASAVLLIPVNFKLED